MSKHDSDLQKIIELGKVASNSDGDTARIDAFGPIKFVYSMFLIFLNWTSLTLEVFGRRQFGERYLTVLRLFLAWMTLGLYRFLFMLVQVVTNFRMDLSIFGGERYLSLSGTTPFFRLYTFAVLGLGLYHLWQIRVRNKRSIPWHSASSGITWLENLPVKMWTFYRFVEPCAFMIIGLIIANLFDRLLGNWIMYASVSMFFKNHLLYTAHRSRYLNWIDSQIENFAQIKMPDGDGDMRTQKTHHYGYVVTPAESLPRFEEDEEEQPDLERTVQDVMGT